MSSHDSIPSPPSYFSDEEKITRTMGDVIKDYDTEELIDYLDRNNLKLKDSHFAIFRKQEIDGSSFLDMTKDEFREIGFALGPAKKLAKFVEELNETKLRSFSSYKTLDELKDVLRKYKVNGEEITDIKQFNPVFEEIDDDDKALEQCMNEIVLRLTNLETMQDSANEETRCVFITSILNASLAIAQRFTKEKIYISYQRPVSGEESSGRVDYAIKGKEDLVCIAEGKPRNVEIGYLQNIMQLDSAYHTNKKKRIADQAFQNDDYDYLYGIVSTATEWHFIVFATDGLYCTSKSEYRINGA